MSAKRAGLGLNQAVQDSEKHAGATENLVFRPGLNFKWQNKDNPVSFCILPAIPILPDGTPDKGNYMAYRDAQFQFTEWLSVFKQHRGFCKTMDVVGAQVLFGNSVLDPIDLIWNVANDDERFFPLIAKSPSDRKFSKDAYKTAFIRRPEWRVAVNSVDPFDRENPNKVYLMVMSKTAVIKFKYVGFPERLQEYRETGHYKATNSTWGLCDALDRLRDRPENVLPNIQPGVVPDFNSLFYEGDITNINNLAVCQVKREPSAQGGLDTYNCLVTSMGRIPGNMEMLHNRYDFGTEVFVDITFPELLDKIAKAMLPVSKELLYKAWSDRGPEFNAALQRNSVASGAVTIQAGMARPGMEPDFIPGIHGDPNLGQYHGAGQSMPMAPAMTPPPVIPAASPVATAPPPVAPQVPTAPAGMAPTPPPVYHAPAQPAAQAPVYPAAPAQAYPPQAQAPVYPAAQAPAPLPQAAQPGVPAAMPAAPEGQYPPQPVPAPGENERRSKIRDALSGGGDYPQ